MTSTMNRPLPEMLGRKDSQTYGEWVVQNCPPVRGVPMTALEQRIMKAPMGNDPLSVAIRAHEMVHAKVSPLGTDMEKWVSRGRATMDALIACEELRVNYLATTAGFDMSVLMDGSEESTGERAVAMNAWDDAVRFAIATAGTGGHKKFLNGVRRHNRVWAGVLADIAKRAIKEMKKSDKAGKLASTAKCGDTELSPLGFLYTEMLGEWIDRLCENAPKDPKTDDSDDKTDDGTKGKGDSDSDGEDSDAPKKRGRKPVSPSDKDKTGEAIDESRRVNPIGGLRDALVEWFPLNVEKCPHPTVLPGHMGKKRVPAVSGKSPRRLHRLLTDPDRRVFDRVVRGKGGVVVVDASGSMRLTAQDVRRVVESAPGATVLVYTVLNGTLLEDGSAKHPNCWVLADKGRMVDTMPFDGGRCNGVDLPALRHALTYRNRATVPVVWVSDCQVTGMNDHSTEHLLMETLRFVMRNNIIVMPTVDEAVKALEKLTNGEKVKSQYSEYPRYVWEKVMGTPLI